MDVIVGGGGGSVYNETVYRPKDHKVRAQKRRKRVLIAIVAVLLLVLLVIIIAVAVAKGHKPEQALRLYPVAEDNLIKFDPSDETTYKKYTDGLQKLVDDYQTTELKYSSSLYNCSEDSFPSTNTDNACKFDVELQTKLTSHFGYDTRHPTVILQLKPPLGWTPTLYGEKSDAPDKPASSILSSDHVPVTCTGQDYADEDNIGPVKLTPALGFPTRYFPYNGQKVYLAPLVAVQFMNLTPSVLVTVRCRAHDPAIGRSDRRLFETTVYIEMNN